MNNSVRTGSLRQRLNLNVGQEGIVGRGLTIVDERGEILRGIIGWGVVQK